MPRGGGQDLPRAGTLPSAKASRHGARAKKFAPRENALLNKSLPTRRTGERVCPARKRSPRRKHPDTAHERKDLPAREGSPRRKPPDTAHEQKNLPRARTLPTAKASRHGARAKGFAPAREHAPRRRPPDTAHGRKDLPRGATLSSAKASRHGARAKRFARAGTRPSAKASRHGARAKGFAPRENAPRGEGLPTRHTGERICPAQKRSPRRRPPDTAHGRKDLPRGVRVRPTCRRTAGRPRPTDSRKTPLRRGRTREGAAAAEFIHRKK